MKKGWIIFTTIVVIIIAVVAIVGGKMYMDNKKLDEDMNEVVHSKEAKEVFENGLKNLDENALTNQGVIKTYKIDDGSIEKNPMGGINVTLFINNEKSLYVYFILDKNSEGELKDSGGGNSASLEKLLQEG